MTEIESCFALDAHEYATVFIFYRETSMSNRFVHHMLPRGNVELPTVPWAGDDLTAQFTFAKWPTLVWTDAIQRVVTALYVKQRDYFTGSNNLQRTARRAFCCRGNANPITHETTQFIETQTTCSRLGEPEAMAALNTLAATPTQPRRTWLNLVVA
jgi:hypothetical protein